MFKVLGIVARLSCKCVHISQMIQINTSKILFVIILNNYKTYFTRGQYPYNRATTYTCELTDVSCTENKIHDTLIWHAVNREKKKKIKSKSFYSAKKYQKYVTEIYLFILHNKRGFKFSRKYLNTLNANLRIVTIYAISMSVLSFKCNRIEK